MARNPLESNSKLREEVLALQKKVATTLGELEELKKKHKRLDSLGWQALPAIERRSVPSSTSASENPVLGFDFLPTTSRESSASSESTNAPSGSELSSNSSLSSATSGQGSISPHDSEYSSSPISHLSSEEPYESLPGHSSVPGKEFELIQQFLTVASTVASLLVLAYKAPQGTTLSSPESLISAGGLKSDPEAKRLEDTLRATLTGEVTAKNLPLPSAEKEKIPLDDPLLRLFVSIAVKEMVSEQGGGKWPGDKDNVTPHPEGVVAVSLLNRTLVYVPRERALGLASLARSTAIDAIQPSYRALCETVPDRQLQLLLRAYLALQKAQLSGIELDRLITFQDDDTRNRFYEERDQIWPVLLKYVLSDNSTDLQQELREVFDKSAFLQTFVNERKVAELENVVAQSTEGSEVSELTKENLEMHNELNTYRLSSDVRRNSLSQATTVRAYHSTTHTQGDENYSSSNVKKDDLDSLNSGYDGDDERSDKRRDFSDESVISSRNSSSNVPQKPPERSFASIGPKSEVLKKTHNYEEEWMEPGEIAFTYHYTDTDGNIKHHSSRNQKFCHDLSGGGDSRSNGASITDGETISTSSESSQQSLQYHTVSVAWGEGVTPRGAGIRCMLEYLSVMGLQKGEQANPTNTLAVIALLEQEWGSNDHVFSSDDDMSHRLEALFEKIQINAHPGQQHSFKEGAKEAFMHILQLGLKVDHTREKDPNSGFVGSRPSRKFSRLNSSELSLKKYQQTGRSSSKSTSPIDLNSSPSHDAGPQSKIEKSSP